MGWVICEAPTDVSWVTKKPGAMQVLQCLFRTESTFIQFINRLPHEKHLKCHLISNKYKAEGLGPASLKSMQPLFLKWIGSGTEKIPSNIKLNEHQETNKPASQRRVLKQLDKRGHLYIFISDYPEINRISNMNSKHSERIFHYVIDIFP